ncbi:MAG: hypothetical protein COA91_02830 [Robiginitomaculum sp.]|nr:MAG: hypothetical protein COA91_02830 [Robiginitomaculum sp.]
MHNRDNDKTTTFREKMAWVMVVGLMIAAGLYFYIVLNISASMDQVPKPVFAGLTVIFIVILTVFAIFGASVAALSNIGEADLPMDERDKLISLRATRLSSIATVVILIMTMTAYFFDARSSDMLLGIMAALIVGHLVDYITQIYLYRRGA